MSKELYERAVNAWVSAASAQDAERVRALLADDIVVYPPFQDEPAMGIEAVTTVFGAFAEVTKNFKYGRTWIGEDSAVIEFTATIDGRAFKGLDIIRIDGKGKIAEFEIAGRPPSGVAALRAAVHARLRGQA